MNQIEKIEKKRVLLAGVNLNEDKDYEASMKELKNLVKACDMVAEARIDQNLSCINAAYYVGSGKVGEIRETVEALDIDYVIFNDTLSPSQLKNLQNEIEVPIWDRTYLILEIFSRRARTKEARMQVQSARLQYMLPRLTGLRASLGRQGGASGSLSNKGSGEKQIELDRRKIESQISELRRELERMEQERVVQRKRRGQSTCPQAALVGYTNAGKSTLMNKMVELYSGREDKMVMSKDMLFATLDTTVRKITPGDNRDFLLSDTVGFISKLPHSLVKAFRSTLDEIRYADLLLHVVDFSDEHYREQMQITEDTLAQLGAGDIPRIFIMNKADKAPDGERIPKVAGDHIYMSAKLGIGIQELLQMMNDTLFSGYKEAEFLIPYENGDLVSYLNDSAVILERQFLEDGVFLKVSCRESDYVKYRNHLTERLMENGND